MLKTLGILLIISGFGAYGLAAAKQVRERVEQLRNMRMALGFLEKEITYMHTPLPRALSRTSQFTSAPLSIFFKESSTRLLNRQGVTASEAWDAGLLKLRKCSKLENEDIELLTAVSTQLGMTDAAEQRKFFSLIAEELKLQEDKARTDAQANSKIKAYGGFILGITVVLLLV